MFVPGDHVAVHIDDTEDGADGVRQAPRITLVLDLAFDDGDAVAHVHADDRAWRVASTRASGAKADELRVFADPEGGLRPMPFAAS
jgi:hypothetical protein